MCEIIIKPVEPVKIDKKKKKSVQHKLLNYKLKNINESKIFFTSLFILHVNLLLFNKIDVYCYI